MVDHLAPLRVPHVSPTELLARLMKAEARGEPLAGKLAVGCVVLKRVRDFRWPNTIPDVILQPWQFSCCNRDDPNLAMMLKPAPKDYYGYAECLAGGHVVDPTGGATHYHADYVRPSWSYSDKMQRLVSIGRHVFYFERFRYSWQDAHLAAPRESDFTVRMGTIIEDVDPDTEDLDPEDET